MYPKLPSLKPYFLRFLLLACASVIPLYSQAGLLPQTEFQAIDANGNPLSGGKVYTYSAGTTTPLVTYTDSTGIVPNANPVILNSAGRASIWIANNAYKIVVTDANGVTQYSQDNVSNNAAGFNPAAPIISTVTSPPAFAYLPVAYTPLTYTNADNASFPAPYETTLGTLASPVLGEVPGMFCGMVGSTNSTSSDSHFGDPSAQPSCIKAYSIAADNAAKSNVISVVGVSQTNGGCKNPGGSPCSTNSTGGIGVGGFANLNTANASTWGGWFTARDHGFSGAMSGIESDIFASTARSEGQYRGIQSVDVDESGGTQNVNGDWGVYSAGFGKGYVYSSGGLPGTSFTALDILSGTSAANANTKVLDFQSGQLGPFNVGLDFTNATFTDSAIKNASIKQPKILTGITNGTGFTHLSACQTACTVSIVNCTTAATAGSTCSNAITLPVVMADTAYQASCSGVAIASGAPMLYIIGKSTTTLTVGTQAATAAVAGFGEIDCMIAHN